MLWFENASCSEKMQTFSPWNVLNGKTVRVQRAIIGMWFSSFSNVSCLSRRCAIIYARPNVNSTLRNGSTWYFVVAARKAYRCVLFPRDEQPGLLGCSRDRGQYVPTRRAIHYAAPLFKFSGTTLQIHYAILTVLSYGDI